MRVITITNQKGGVAKTTTATALADGLHRKGKKTLLIDADPQCSASDTFRAETEEKATLYDVLCHGEPILNAIQKTKTIDIVPCDILLSGAEAHFAGVKVGREYKLKEALDSVKNNYDYIIIDTPPELGVIITSALTASDSCIIPVFLERYSLKGLEQLNVTIEEIQKYSNPGLKIEGILLTKCNSRQNLTKVFMEQMSNFETYLKTKTFETAIRECVAVREAQAQRMSLFEYAPKCSAAEDYINFVNEIMEG